MPAGGAFGKFGRLCQQHWRATTALPYFCAGVLGFKNGEELLGLRALTMQSGRARPLDLLPQEHRRLPPLTDYKGLVVDIPFGCVGHLSGAKGIFDGKVFAFELAGLDEFAAFWSEDWRGSVERRFIGLLEY